MKEMNEGMEKESKGNLMNAKMLEKCEIFVLEKNHFNVT